MQTYQDIIQRFKLEPLPEEGGYFRRIYESSRHDQNGRRLAASILYLLNDNDYSCFHRVDCDELWHFHSGQPLIIHHLHSGGELISTLLGDSVTVVDAVPHLCIPRGDWFAAEVLDGKGFGLVSCITVPEFT